MIEPPQIHAPESLSDEEIKPFAALLGSDTSLSSISSEVLERQKRAWAVIIDDQLLEWGRSPEMIEEEGMEAPSNKTIAFACRFAQALADSEVVSPDRVTPDGEGGIIFEWIRGDDCHRLELGENSTIELVVIDSEDRVVRQVLS